MKKGLAVVLAGCLLLGGCGNSGGGGSTTEAGKFKHMASETPLELSVFFHYGTQIFDDEWPVYKKAEEYTNVKLKGTVSKMASDWNVSFNTMISAKPLPDIIWNSRERINQYALMGGFMPLDDLIEKHAPNIKKFFEEHPEMKKEMQASDGKLYMIPNFTEQRVKEIWYVRQDWMDKLGLKAPEDVNDLYNIATAFRTKDPNGNGLQDETPIFGRAGYFQVKKLLNLYGVKMQEMKPFYEDNGQIRFSYMDDTFKEAVKSVNKWYAEGLIDQELYTRKDARTFLLSNNMGGISNDFHGSNDQMNDQYKDVIPGFSFQPIMMPKDINGEVWDGTGGPNGYGFGWGISANNKHPEETIKYMDFWFTEDGKTLNSMGVEGLSYETVNGERRFTDEYLHGTDTLPVMMDKIGADQAIGGVVTMEFNKGYLRPELFELTQKLPQQVNYLPPFPNLPLSQDDLTKVKNLMNAIYSFTDEKLQKWVVGAENVDAAYSDYLAQLKTLGIDEVLSIYNKAYQAYQAQ